MFLRFFPLWAPLAALLGFLLAPHMTGWGGAIVPLLTVVMLCMGLTLKPADFIAVGGYKKAFLLGIVLQFTVMPISALLIAKLFSLSPELTVGLVLVGSVGGGTSSNVLTYIAGGNVALSVSMTAFSTLASVLMTPMLLSLLGFDSVICRTIAIEVGMQNSGLATALALKFFAPISALPGAIFSVWLNITGSIFASMCARSDKQKLLK